jgi:hypothetical protein
VGQTENELIEELLGQADYMATEIALLKQRYQLAAEEATRLRGGAAWLETVPRTVTGTEGLDPERLVLAVATSANGPLPLGEVTVLEAETLHEPFGARRSAAPSAVELIGHDASAAKPRSRELISGRPSPLRAPRLDRARRGRLDRVRHRAGITPVRQAWPQRLRPPAGRAGGVRDTSPGATREGRVTGRPVPLAGHTTASTTEDRPFR